MNINQIVSLVFSIIIIIYGFASLLFLLYNNFNPQFLQILYPSIGAILFSIFLAFNAFFIQKDEIQKFQISTAILIDTKNGKLYSMAVEEDQKLPYDNELLNGISRIDSFLENPPFKSSQIEKDLLDPQKSEPQIFDILEYIFLAWFSQSELKFNYIPKSKINRVYGGSSSGKFDDNFKSINLDLTNEVNYNNIYKEFHKKIILNLPVGSDAKAKNENNSRNYYINTKKSILSISIIKNTPEKLSALLIQNNNIAKLIIQSLGLQEDKKEKDRYLIYYYEILLTFKTKVVYRFSNQSKIEKDWFNKLKERIEKDFSWEIIRKEYLK